MARTAAYCRRVLFSAGKNGRLGDMMQHVMTTYGRPAIAFARGEGSWMWERKGNRYLA